MAVTKDELKERLKSLSKEELTSLRELLSVPDGDQSSAVSDILADLAALKLDVAALKGKKSDDTTWLDRLFGA